MTKSKNTKRALLMSVLSMMLCMAMLVGSTFAWFTDNVTSGKNRIVAGNLDVELYYKTTATDTEGYKNVKDIPENEQSPFFRDETGEPITWEPGVMAYTYFKVTNEGSLALKYMLTTVAEDYNTFKGLDLRDVIKFAVIKGKADLSDGRGSAALSGLTYADFESFAPTGTLEAKPEEGESSDIFTVVAYWAPNVKEDNLYNVNNGDKTDDNADQLYINIEISLRATQYTSEEDSFGNEYDAKSEYDDGIALVADFTKDFTPAVDAAKPTVIQNDGLKVTLPAGICKTGDTITLKSSLIEFDKVDEDTNSQRTVYDIEVLINGIKVEAEGIEVTVYVGKGFTDLTVLHNGIEITEKHYDAQTGDVTFTTDSFSPYSFIATMPRKVATAEDMTAAIAKGEDVALTEDIALTDIVEVTDDVTIYANGKTITTDASRFMWADNDDVTVTIDNANLVSTNTSSNSRGLQINPNKSNVDLIVKDSTITMNNVGDNYGVNICGGVTNSSLTLINCEITAYQCVNIYGSDMTVNIEGCTFTYVNTHNKGWSGGYITLFCSEGCRNIDLTVKNTKFITGTVAEEYGYPHPPVYLREPSGNEGHTITVENCTWDDAAYTYSK